MKSRNTKQLADEIQRQQDLLAVCISNEVVREQTRRRDIVRLLAACEIPRATSEQKRDRVPQIDVVGRIDNIDRQMLMRTVEAHLEKCEKPLKGSNVIFRSVK